MEGIEGMPPKEPLRSCLPAGEPLSLVLLLMLVAAGILLPVINAANGQSHTSTQNTTVNQTAKVVNTFNKYKYLLAIYLAQTHKTGSATLT